MSPKKSTATATAPTAPAVPSVSVLIKPETRPGLKACGDYLVGKAYTVPASEAARLVDGKGFDCASEGDATTLREWQSAQAAHLKALDEFNAANAATQEG